MKPEHLQLLLTREMTFGKYKGRVPSHLSCWVSKIASCLILVIAQNLKQRLPLF